MGDGDNLYAICRKSLRAYDRDWAMRRRAIIVEVRSTRLPNISNLIL